MYPPEVDFQVVPTTRTLLRSGTVLTLDPDVGDFERADVLIDGDTIAAIGPDLSAADADVIDANDMIVIPGFVASHRHIWEGVLRNIGTDVPLEGRTSYISFVLHKLAPAFRPEDAYIGNLLSSLGAIDAGITTHVGVGSYGQDAKVQEMGAAGILGPDTTYIHCTTLNDTEIQMIVDTGGTISIASPVEMMMGHGLPPIQKFLDRGLAPSLSVDVETNVPADMFTQMQSVLGLQHTLAAAAGAAPVTPRQVLTWATLEGARANGLDRKVGTLTPGKQADVVLLRADRLNVTPLHDPATAVVTRMHTGNVDTVLIGGRAMKRGGTLLHVDWPAVRRLAAESRDFVVQRSGFRLPRI